MTADVWSVVHAIVAVLLLGIIVVLSPLIAGPCMAVADGDGVLVADAVAVGNGVPAAGVVGAGVFVAVAVADGVFVAVAVGNGVFVAVATSPAVLTAATALKGNVLPLTEPPTDRRWTSGVMVVNGTETETVMAWLLLTIWLVSVTGQDATFCRHT